MELGNWEWLVGGWMVTRETRQSRFGWMMRMRWSCTCLVHVRSARLLVCPFACCLCLSVDLMGPVSVCGDTKSESSSSERKYEVECSDVFLLVLSSDSVLFVVLLKVVINDWLCCSHIEIHECDCIGMELEWVLLVSSCQWLRLIQSFRTYASLMALKWVSEWMNELLVERYLSDCNYPLMI